jgi:uncharacterized protein
MARLPAVDGWFTLDDKPALLGSRCLTCATVFFPAITFFCRNPECDGAGFEPVSLSRQGKIWSYTDAQYQPPPPYIPSPDGHEPFALAAVELEAERMVVLGQVATGFGVQDLYVGQEVELVVEPLYRVDDLEYVVYRWRPTGAAA